MELVDGYDHQSGVHCGAVALRNVAAYYGWDYSEAACFGIGGGPAFVRHDHPDEPWATFRASAPRLERAFLEHLGVPHSFRSGDDFETAWANVTAHVDEDDPVLLFLDPAPLDYLPGEPAHLPPHVAVLVGYDDGTALLSDGAVEGRREVSHATLRDAWTRSRGISLAHDSLVVTRARTIEPGNDAAAAGFRQAATSMLDPLQVKRDARGPGEEGLPALRAFADDLGRWPDLPDPAGPVRAARRSIDEHGDGTAFRALYAEALGELGRRAGLPPDLADRMARVARQWETVGARLDDVLGAPDPDPAIFAEAASLVVDVADREATIFGTIADELGRGGH